MKGTSALPHPERPAVWHVVAPGKTGGLETVVRALAIGRHRRGYDVRVLSVVGAGDPEPELHADLRQARVELTALRLPPRSYLRERSEIRTLLGRNRPDVVHTHGYRPDVLTSAIARSLGIATVTTVHGFTGGDWRNRLYEQLQIRSFRRIDAVAAVSVPIQRRLLAARVPASRLYLVRNGWDGAASHLTAAAARQALGVADNCLHIGWVGRLSREKGADVMLEALPHLSDIPLALSIVGDGAEREPLEHQARELRLGDRVRWHGQQPAAGRLFPGFDAFVLSSRTEGTPMVLLEAMAAGVPVISTAVGGVPDIITSAEGVLVPPEDPSALAQAIRMIHDDPAGARLRAATASRRLSQQFGLEPWLEQYERIYQTVSLARRS